MDKLREFHDCIYENVLHEGDEQSPNDYASLRLVSMSVPVDATDTLLVTLSNGVTYEVKAR